MTSSIFDLKNRRQIIVIFLSVVSWTFAVSGTPAPLADIHRDEDFSAAIWFFNSCSTTNKKIECDKNTGCSGIDEKRHAGAATSIISIILLTVLCAIFISRVFLPQILISNQTIRSKLSYIVIGLVILVEVFLLISFALAFALLHVPCQEYDGKTLDGMGYHAAPGGFLLLTSFLFLVATFIVEKCFGAEKEFLKNNNVVMPDEQEDAKDDQAARGGEYQQVQ